MVVDGVRNKGSSPYDATKQRDHSDPNASGNHAILSTTVGAMTAASLDEFTNIPHGPFDLFVRSAKTTKAGVRRGQDFARNNARAFDTSIRRQE